MLSVKSSRGPFSSIISLNFSNISFSREPALTPTLMEQLLFFAYRVNWDAHSLTCVTEPGGEEKLSVNNVWIESITTKSGFWFKNVSMINSKFTSVIMFIWSSFNFNLSALSFICSADSSPEIYNVFKSREFWLCILYSGSRYSS